MRTTIASGMLAALLLSGALPALADCYGPEVAFGDRTAVTYYAQCANATVDLERDENLFYEAESLEAAARRTHGAQRARELARARAVLAQVLAGHPSPALAARAERERARLASGG